MTKQELQGHIFVGVIEDNLDPKKLGRCKCRVLNIFDEIPVEDLPWASPWKDLNGNQFIVPDKGKVVSVVFDEGNIYKPEYIFAEHYNINLEKKLSELSGSNYASMRALMFDHKTQIYSNDEEGLKIDYKFNNINITDKNINLNLKDNFSEVNIGSNTATQQALLGNHFLDWFDKFLQTIVTNGHLGNLAAPLIPTPSLLDVLREYGELRNPKFLSFHVNIVDNDYVNQQTRIAEGQIGDVWKSTVQPNSIVSSESVDYQSQPGLSTDNSSPSSGDLTVAPDGSNSNNVAKEPGKVNPTTNADALVLIDTMKSKGYKIYTRPYEMNIIGLRRQYEGTAYSNIFIDFIHLVYKIDDTDRWEIKKFPFSTMPGYYQAVEIKKANGTTITAPAISGINLEPGDSWGEKTPNGQPIDIKSTATVQERGGFAILKPAQYVDIYSIGKHCDEPAMINNSNVSVYRDTSSGNIIKYTADVEGPFKIYIQRGYPGGEKVDNWSEGAQVFSTSTHLNEFFKLCEMHKEKYGNKFTYTLMEERHLTKTTLEALLDKTFNKLNQNTTDNTPIVPANPIPNGLTTSTVGLTTSNTVTTSTPTTTTETQNQAEVLGSKPIADLTTATREELLNRIDFLKREIEKLESKATLDPETGLPSLSSADFKKKFDLGTELANVRDVKNKRFGYF